ncbi:unnamed protein product [Anisakis simplex]|uniref:Methyltransferase-like protein 17, mitochondrial (inferred by orthology to a human protein) n=1 Tax=Anisakis simplex TaxID=6269 RepID=A0A0M3JAE4_ANISI|nr:unnamed protein product [Anisakis simplex]
MDILRVRLQSQSPILKIGADDGTNRGAFIHPNVNFRRFIAPSPSNKYDLIIAHRLFVELGSHQSRMDLINTLWNRANKFLVLIDSNLDDSFKALMEARDFILIAGSEIHADEMRRLIDEMSLENADAIETVLNDRSLSSFERFTLLREMVPSEIQLPTRVPTGFVYAPCPHDQGCPKLSSKHK